MIKIIIVFKNIKKTVYHIGFTFIIIGKKLYEMPIVIFFVVEHNSNHIKRRSFWRQTGCFYIKKKNLFNRVSEIIFEFWNFTFVIKSFHKNLDFLKI